MFEKNADMVQYYLKLDNDKQVALRESELVLAWKRGDLSYSGGAVGEDGGERCGT